jgi:hypothetical protein
MPTTTDTQPEMIFAPAPGLLAMVCLAQMTRQTAVTEYVACRNEPAPKVITIGRQQIASQLEEAQNTSSTVPEAHREPCCYTDLGLVAFEPASVPHTTSVARSFRARDAIFELRRLSGLTWEELATSLSVTRRSLHLWANGAAINAPNEKRVRDLLSTMRKLDRGTGRENRGLLLALLPDGGTIGELLQAGRLEDALRLAGQGRGRAVGAATHEAAPRAEKLSVVDMLGTRSDRLHTDETIALPPRRGPRRGV